MKTLEHQVNLAEMAMQYEKRTDEIIDFSSNSNPLISEALEARLMSILQMARNYPDSQYIQLRQSIASYLECDMEEIIPGNGSDEISSLLMKGLDEMMQKEGRKFRLGIVYPTPIKYEQSAKLNHMEVVAIPLEKQEEERKAPIFKWHQELVLEKLDEIDGLLICNPNYPTGNVQEIQELVELFDRKQKWLIIDESFMEFVEQEGFYSQVKEVWRYEQLVVIKSFSKFFGLPGMRLGYGVVSHSELREIMYKYQELYSINSFAEGLAQVMLQDRLYIEESKDYFVNERIRIDGLLRGIPNLTIYKSYANFILLRLHHMTSTALREKLFEEENIFIGDISHLKGLDEHFVVINIKRADENQKLIEALEKHLV